MKIDDSKITLSKPDQFFLIIPFDFQEQKLLFCELFCFDSQLLSRGNGDD